MLNPLSMWLQTQVLIATRLLVSQVKCGSEMSCFDVDIFTEYINTHTHTCVCVCVCLCARARARVCVCREMFTVLVSIKSPKL